MTRGRQSNARNKPPKVPPPPATLDSDERAVWAQVCKAQNAEWLDTGPGPLLEDYCVAVCRQRRLRSMIRIEEADPDNKGLASDSLYELSEKVSQSLQRLARGLRLTPQSRIRADKADNKPSNPWDDEGDDGDDSN